jgi:hypothetical protein
MRRYLQHVPPTRFNRVRYFGWMHPAAKRRRAIVDGARQRGDGHAEGVARGKAEGALRGRPIFGRSNTQTLLAAAIVVREKPEAPPQWHLLCPHCQAFALVAIGRIKPQARAPP